MPNPLTVAEQFKLSILDEEVGGNISVFVKLAYAFKEIRDDELWKSAGFASFAEYCKSKGLSEGRVNEFIHLADLVGGRK